MNLYVGTSGYSYKEWKGTFYPKNLPAQQMLRFYGVTVHRKMTKPAQLRAP